MLRHKTSQIFLEPINNEIIIIHHLNVQSIVWKYFGDTDILELEELSGPDHCIAHHTRNNALQSRDDDHVQD